MTKRRSFDEKLAQLRALVEQPVNDEDIALLTKTLSQKNNVLAAKAADVIGKMGLRALSDAVTAMFDRYMDRPEETDKGCLAKTAAVKTLTHLDARDEKLFLRALRHVQFEPVYGGQVDTAAAMRGQALIALVNMGYEDIHYEAVNLLMDKEPQPRRDAVQVLRALGDRDCALLLRIKIMSGDKEPEILDACFEALMQIDPTRSIKFVRRFLDDKNENLAIGAAMAIGESRDPQAFAILGKHYEKKLFATNRENLLLPIALIRSDESLAFLLDIIRNQPMHLAKTAVRVLMMYQDQAPAREQIQQAVQERGDQNLDDIFADVFG